MSRVSTCGHPWNLSKPPSSAGMLYLFHWLSSTTQYSMPNFSIANVIISHTPPMPRRCWCLEAYNLCAYSARNGPVSGPYIGTDLTSAVWTQLVDTLALRRRHRCLKLVSANWAFCSDIRYPIIWWDATVQITNCFLFSLKSLLQKQGSASSQSLLLQHFTFRLCKSQPKYNHVVFRTILK